ncbi:MAG: biopolymer transporter ExbD [Oscillospiraceae bacterium]|nr:biopolymer transporter ExbD [Oscillospiraceae bacterium]
MNKRQLHLDFTSLLDVFMIILFFFVIFSKLETDDIKQDLDEQRSQIAAQSEQAEQKEDEAHELLNDAQKKNDSADIRLEEANQAADRSGENADAIMEFGESNNIKFSLQMSADTNDWCINVLNGQGRTDRIEKSDVSSMTDSVISILRSCGYSEDDTVLLEFFYDATENGTTSAYKQINKMMTQLKKKYTHLFYSETDRSLL